jgi:hypothetical protein
VSAITTLVVRYPDGDDVNWLCESQSLRVNAMNGGRAWSDAELARELRFARLAQTSAGSAEFCRTLRNFRMTQRPPSDSGTVSQADDRQTVVPCESNLDRRPSTRSLRGLDWLNFLLADVQTGVGPFLAIYQPRWIDRARVSLEPKIILVDSTI